MASRTTIPVFTSRATRRLVAEQHCGAFGDGAGDGDPLLFAAGKLGRKVVQPRAELDQPQRLLGRHRSRAISVIKATFSRAVRLGMRL